MKFYYYKIKNIENGSFYIGITTNPKNRKQQHFELLKIHKHPNYKIQKDYDIYGKDVFEFIIIEEKDFSSEEEAYQYEYELIQTTNATSSYNIAEGGHLNPVYSPQIIQKIKQTHQAKYDNVLQYSFDGKQFKLENVYGSIRDAAKGGHDFRAIQNSLKSTQAHHNYYWILENEKENWLNRFLQRHTCCVAKINEQTEEIEDSALTIKEFANKYNTTYNKIYHSLKRGDRCERKYKFIRITANQFAELNNLSL